MKNARDRKFVKLIYLCLITGHIVLCERISFIKQEWPAGGERFVIELHMKSKYCFIDVHLNKNLLSKDYYEMHHSNNTGDMKTRFKTRDEISMCYYIGSIESVNYSWASISTCEGIQGLIHDGNGLYTITDRLPERSDDLMNTDVNELIIENVVKSGPDFSCGRGIGLFDANEDMQDDITAHGRTKREVPIPYNANETSRYIELLLVIDNSLFKATNGNLDFIYDRCKKIVNIVNSAYQHFNVFVALVGVEVWKIHDKIDVTQEANSTLDNFSTYARTLLNEEHVDNVQLISHIDFSEGILGLSSVGTMCSMHSTAINKDSLRNIEIVAITVAHEIGHNMGLYHDGLNVTCSLGRYCIMYPFMEEKNTVSIWSAETIKNATLNLRERNKFSCLNNKPVSLFDGPQCGNGFLEQGEECDCGIPEKCDNPCCVATTCKFQPNATCAVGKCCDLNTCTISLMGEVCREASHSCDLPEYCSGSSEHCPEDLFKAGGEFCSGGSVCKNNKCPGRLFNCADNCNAKGICNSKGQCHCNDDFQPPLCFYPGHGGSIDSGPARYLKHASSLQRSIFLFVAVFPLAVILILFLYFYILPKFRCFRKWRERQTSYQECSSTTTGPVVSMNSTPPSLPSNIQNKPKRTSGKENPLIFSIQRELVGKYDGVVISPLIVKAPGAPKLKPVRPAPEIPIIATHSTKSMTFENVDDEKRYENIMSNESDQLVSSNISKPKRKPPPVPVVDYVNEEENYVKNIRKVYENKDESRSLTMDAKNDRVGFRKC